MDSEDFENDRLPINATPIQVCASAVGRLADVWDEVADRTGQGIGIFLEEIFGGIWRDGDSGEKFEREFDRWNEQPEEMQPLGALQAMFTSCAYACQGMKAQKEGDLVLAWQYTARCNYWLGLVVGFWSIRSLQSNSKVEFAKMGAKARHRENRAMKAQVLEWYAAHSHEVRSKDAAAGEVAGKVVPVTFRTVRDWLKGA